MRILLLSDRYPPYYEGGYELNCQQIAEGLRDRGHRVRVLTSVYGVGRPRRDGHVWRHLLLARSSTTYLPGRLDRLVAFFRSRANYRTTRALLARLRPDLVFVGQLNDTSVTPVLAAQDAGVRTVFRLGSHWLALRRQEHLAQPSRLRRLYWSWEHGLRTPAQVQVDAAVVVSQSLLEAYAAAGFDMGRAAVIPSGVPASWIAARVPQHPGPGHTPTRLLYAGRLEAAKGTDVVLAAVEELVRGGVRVTLDLAGRGVPEYTRELERRVRRAGLEGCVRFLGFVEREKLLGSYGAYHILLFATPLFEGLPMTVVEAMSQGLVVVASRVGGAAELIDSGRNGLLVRPADPGDMARAVRRLVGDPEWAQALAREATQTVHRRHTFERMLDQYEEYLEAWGTPASAEPTRLVGWT
ncbi:MAG: glycosyltransferase family 4 protein [Candidatus Latescibacterota bacterium]